MNDSKIKVLLVEPEKYQKEIEIDDSLEAMQEVVGGDIEEYMPFDDDVAIICNEEGKVRGLPLNRAVYVQDNDKKEMVDIICGKFFICYAPPESESFQSLPILIRIMRLMSKNIWHTDWCCRKIQNLKCMK